MSFSEPSLISPCSSGRWRSRRRAVLDRFGADQHRLLDDLARHHVDRPADVAVDHEVAAVRGGDRALRGSQVDSDGQVLFFGAHRFPYLPASCSVAREYARIPSKSARASRSRYSACARSRASSGLDERGDLGQDRRHLGLDEHEEGRRAHAAVADFAADFAHRADQAPLHRGGQAAGLLLAQVAVDAVEELAHVGHANSPTRGSRRSPAR